MPDRASAPRRVALAVVATGTSSPAPSTNWWQRLAERLAPSASTIEAGELRSKFDALDTTSIADAPIAVRVRVGGTVRSLTLRCRAQVPALEVDLYDGSDALTLVFLGRRVIRGITPGPRPHRVRTGDPTGVRPW